MRVPGFTHEQEEQIKKEARQIKKSLAFTWLMKYLEADAFEQIKASNADDIDVRESLYVRLRVIGDFRAILDAVVEKAERGEDL